MHKLITRVLAARLSGVVGKLVRELQSVFIRERSIFLRMDGGLGSGGCMKCTEEWVVFEIDFENSYDCVD